MDRRTFIAGASVVVAAPLAAQAQPAGKIPRVGVIHMGPAGSAPHFVEAFNQGMRERGYIEGRNVLFERRYGEARIERVREVAAELVQMKVDVIVIATDQGIATVRQQTRTIPIVMANSTDPVGTGFVASLARPGGNITGMSAMSPELSGKQLELLKEIVPGLARVAILWNPDMRGAVLNYQATEAAARALRLQLQSVEATHADQLEQAFSAMTAARAEALMVPLPNPVAFLNRQRIADFAQRNRLLAISSTRDFAEAGGLMVYGVSIADQWRRAATHVDRILKGAKPGELPVEQPAKLDLVINLKTAHMMGLTIPHSLLQRADQVIR
jgi:putative ABC transport system substrate-binding protein